MRQHDTHMTDVDECYEALASCVARSGEQMSPESRQDVRSRLLAQITTARVPLYRRLLQPAIALATATALVGGVGYAAAASAPGSALYPLKRSVTAAVQAVSRTFSPPVQGPAAHMPVSVPVGDSTDRASGSSRAGGTQGGAGANPPKTPSPQAVGPSKTATGSKQGEAPANGVKGTGDVKSNNGIGSGKKDDLASPDSTHGQDQRVTPKKSNGKASPQQKSNGKKH